MKRLMPRFGASLALLLATAAVAHAATLSSTERAAEVVVVRNLMIEDGEVSGELVNQTQHAVRDVQLQIRHLWQWKNEFQPGKDEFSKTVFHTVEGEIPPGGSLPFGYKPSPPLPARPDGFFETSVSIAGFAEVFR